MDSDNEEKDFNGFNNGKELHLGDDFEVDDSDEDLGDEEDDDDKQQIPQPPTFTKQPAAQLRMNPIGQVGAQANTAGKGGFKAPQKQENTKEDTIKVSNQPFDEAVNITGDSEEDIPSDDDDGNNEPPQSNFAGQQQVNYAAAQAQRKVKQNTDSEEEEEEDDQDDGTGVAKIPGSYNPAEYAGLEVSDEIQDLFQYITRFKPHHIDLESKLKPFIPDYIPAVGEVDAFIKPSRPDTKTEELGLTILDEPALNQIDPNAFEMLYIQKQKIVNAVPLEVRSIENAEKNQKQISRWIQNVNDLHVSRPPPTVNYSKQMPDIEMLMQEWHPEMQEALNRIEFPGPEIELSTADYAKIICTILDIPVHKLANNKGTIEALHVLFTLYNEFKQSHHFQHLQNPDGNEGHGDGENYLAL